MKLIKVLLYIAFFYSGYDSFGNQLNYDYYKKSYPEENSIVLNKKIQVSYYIDKTTGELSAKSVHQIERLYLNDVPEDIHLIQIPFNSYQELKLKNAKLFRIDSIGELQLKENTKVKYAEVKEYYIEGIFYNDLKVKQFSPKLGINEKNILKYSYEYKYTDLKFLNSIHVCENDEPIVNFELKIDIPDEVKVYINKFNIPDSKLGFKKEKKDNGTELIYTLTNSKLPVTNELSPSVNYYAPHFVIQTKSYTYNGVKKNILESTNDLYKWYNTLIEQLNTNNAVIQKHTTTLITNKKTDHEKIDTIYKWCQSKIQYVAFEDGIAGFKPDEAQNVLKNGYGDCKGVANLLVEMLRCAGFNANHAWIGTRHLPYDYSLPSIIVDNHMICALKLEDKTFFLDGTDHTSKWDTPSSHIQGKQVLVGHGREYEILIIPIAEASTNKTTINFKGHFEKNKLIIQGELAISGIPKNNFKSFIHSVDNNKKEQAKFILLEKYLEDFVPASDVSNDIHEYNNNLTLNIKGYFIGCYLINSNEIYLFPKFDSKFNHVEYDKFETPISFNYKEEFNLIAEITLPNDSDIIIPEDLEYSTPDRALVGNISYTIVENVLVIKKNIAINTLLLEDINVKLWDAFTENLLLTSKKPVIIKL